MPVDDWRSTMVERGLVKDAEFLNRMIEERRRKGIDLYDEVWDGVYIMAPMADNYHQTFLDDIGDILTEVVKRPGLGKKCQGANVSDRRKGWESNFRVPDLVVVLHDSKAIDCGTHFFGGPDFLIEIESPGDETEEKVPFYSKIGVRELLIIHRDKRTLRLLRHDGQDLIEVKPSPLEGKDWLVSAVLPLAFRRTVQKGTPRTRVRRTDGQAGEWTV
jgi:Uma2 family endonuclease